jgi:hypothetical protein
MQELQYTQKTRSGATVSVNAYITFEGNPVMRVAEYRNWESLSRTRMLLIRMELDYPEQEEVKRVGKIRDGKISAFREQWMNLIDYFALLADFEKHGTEYIHTFALTAK